MNKTVCLLLKWSIFRKIFFLVFSVLILTRSNNFSCFSALKTIEGICFVVLCILFYYNNLLIEMSQILRLMLYFHLFFNNRFLVCVIGLGRFTSKLLSMFFLYFALLLFWFYKFFKTFFIFMLNFNFLMVTSESFSFFLFYFIGNVFRFFFGLILFNLKVLFFNLTYLLICLNII